MTGQAIPLSLSHGLATGLDTSGEAIFFLHLPKTAGTTLTAILHSTALFRRQRYLRVTYLHTDWDETDDAAAISGHGYFDVTAPEFRRWRLITIVREPIERLVSHLAMGLQRGWCVDSDIARTLAAPPPSPGNGVPWWFPYAWYGNLQTRLIAGISEERPLEDADLDRAIRLIDEHYFVAAPQDRFDDLIAYLIGCFGWPDLAYPRIQVGGYAPPEISAETRGILLERERLDYALYEHVRDRFADKLGGLSRRPARSAKDHILAVPPVLDGAHPDKLVYVSPIGFAQKFARGWPLDTSGRPMFLD